MPADKPVQGQHYGLLAEFGTPEAMWHLEVRDFPAIVTMDAHGNSLHKQVEEESGAILETFK